MTEHAVGEWMADIDVSRLYGSQMELKFVAVAGNDFSKSVWESGDNRTVTLPLMSDGEVVADSVQQERTVLTQTTGYIVHVQISLYVASYEVRSIYQVSRTDRSITETEVRASETT